MVRNIVAVLLGVMLATVVILVLEMVGKRVYPLPDGVDPNDQEALAKALPNMPTGAFLFLLLTYAAGSFVGGFLAARVARRAPVRQALIVGAVLMALGLANLLMLPGQPAWFWAASLLVYLPTAYLGSRLAPRPPSPQGPATESLAA
jgi:hypothetical protein